MYSVLLYTNNANPGQNTYNNILPNITNKKQKKIVTTKKLNNSFICNGGCRHSKPLVLSVGNINWCKSFSI